MKNIIKTKTLFGAGLTALAFSSIFTPTAFAQTCATVPTCDELGYDLSASDCTGKKALKCPFDNTKFYCPDGGEDSNQNCSVGDILYSDKTCNANVVSGKTPIGVVFDATGKLAIALKMGLKTWMNNPYEDVDTLSNIPSSSRATADWQGKNNTAVILAYCQANSKSCPAVEYVNSYSTAGTNAGDWYLPAGGELNAIYGNMGVLNIALSKVGGTALPNERHWSSTECDRDKAWLQNFYNNYIYSYDKEGSDVFEVYVRPVLAF